MKKHGKTESVFLKTWLTQQSGKGNSQTVSGDIMLIVPNRDIDIDVRF